jgi:hypothetical protein
MAAAARNALSFLFSMVANQSVLAIGVLQYRLKRDKNE